MDQVTPRWLIYELTDSTVQLGLVRGVQAIPILLCHRSPASAADRYSRRTQILISQVIDGSSLPPWRCDCDRSITTLACLCHRLRHGCSSDVSAAGARGDHQRRVPTKNLTNAIGLNSIIFNVARSTGPRLPAS